MRLVIDRIILDAVGTKKDMTVAVVIPCYNEEDAIIRCLGALKRQTVKPTEVIVVDNNSSDRTAEIADKLGANVISEERRGLVYARNSGMAAASADIIARIDADTLVRRDWVEQIKDAFSNEWTVAVTGTGDFYDLPFKTFSRLGRNFFAVRVNRVIMGHHMLWGSNMAIRNDAWAQIAPYLCVGADLMEDLDISMHVADEFGGGSIAYRPSMRADISARRATAGLFKNYLYMKMWPDTLRIHRGVRAHLLWPFVGLVAVFWASYNSNIGRIYDADTGKWNLNPQKWSPSEKYDRDNP